MPINPLPAIAKYESSGCTDNYTTLSTSSGCYGFLDSSWKEYSKLVNGASQYARAADAPVSVQTAVAAATINKDGIQPWDCKGCDAKFSAYVVANGGVSNFTTSGLSTDPASYADLDTAAGRTSYFTGNSGSGSGTISIGNGSIALTPGGTTSSSSTSADPTTTTGTLKVGDLGTPWSWTWNAIVVGTRDPIKTALTNVETMSSAVLVGVLLLAIAAMGLRGALQRADMSDFVAFFIKAGFVVAFVSIGSSYYNDYVVVPVQDIPVWWQSYLTGGTKATSQVALFDWVDASTYATSVAIRNSLPWHDFGAALTVTGVRVLIWLALFVMFCAKAGFAIFLFLSTAIGPMIIPTVLFERTAHMFWGWVSVIVTGLLTLFGIDLALSLYAVVMTNLMTAITNTEQSFWGSAAAMVAMGSSVAFLPAMWSRIGGGVTASLSHAKGFLSGTTPLVVGAGLAAGGAAVYAGAGASSTIAVTRMTNSVGSSLSRGL